MKVQCTVVTTPTSDTPGTCILLHFDSKRYLFGHIGEGAQRAFVERTIRLTKISDIFLSGRTEWQNTGGLVGLILTMGDQDAAKNSDSLGNPQGGPKKRKPLERKGVTVHGGENLLHTLATTRPFVFRRAMNLRLREVPVVESADGRKEQAIGAPYFRDENLIVHAMHIYPEEDLKNSTEEIEAGSPSAVGKVKAGATRKRSFDDFASLEKQRESILRGVVEQMFCSDWSMDTMIEEGDPLDAPGPSTDTLVESLPTSSSGPDMSRTRSTSPSKRSKPIPERDPNLSTTLPPLGKTRAPWPASTVHSLPRSRPTRIALSYIVTLHPQRGKFLPVKARELGVVPGPDFSRLTAGEAITTPNGNIVQPADVMEPVRPGTGVAVCDLPDTGYIKDFLAREEWKDTEKVRTEIGCFFWILGSGVSADERLQSFMKQMGHSKHIVSALDVCPNAITFKGGAKSSTKLNLLDEKFFPLPYFSDQVPSQVDEFMEPAKPRMIFRIEPRWEFDTKAVELPFSREAILQEAEPAYVELARIAREGNIKNPGDDSPWKDVEVITLGTGSALPSKYRNVSATLVKVPGAGSILLDAGENTLGQLRRLYDPTELKAALRDLRGLYISHLHADHHLGSAAVLKAWYNEVYSPANSETNQLMNVVAPWKFLVWLREYADVEEFGFSKIRFISCEDLLRKNLDNPNHLTAHLPEVLDSLSLTSIQTSRAVHCLSSFTTSWTWSNGFKIAYSGDTRPTKGFVEIGRDSTVLLHEATFDDELLPEAIAKKHSTTSEAINAGKEMGAKNIILTHFSQRYPKLPILSAAEENGPEVLVAFDLCRVRLGDVKRFGTFIPALKELYEEADEEKIEEEEEVEEEPVVEEKKGKVGKAGGYKPGGNKSEKKSDKRA
ncbi:beta-lactamase-like protein [Tuber borchii]|uniref:ribonuclease Z n=1 Tax=Tuber borchii TaxID=42251 RepID=A0A2T6ZFM1_TUBBO|nr:beta-lactamase-like protein [Tuber borchii]